MWYEGSFRASILVSPLESNDFRIPVNTLLTLGELYIEKGEKILRRYHLAFYGDKENYTGRK
jgi:hypothetical protein